MIKRYKKEFDYSYALGLTLCFELINHKSSYVRCIYVHSKLNRNEKYNEFERLCKKNNIDIIENDKAFNIVSEKENCFVIGVFNKFKMSITDDIHVVLVNPSNSGNLGTILRTALGFDIKNISIIKPGVDVFDPKVVRSSMGAIFNMNIEYFDTFAHYKEKFDRKCYPFVLDGKTNLKDVNFTGIFSLIFGNEASGLDESFNNLGDSVTIKHNNTIDSLSLQIAVSIALYECTKNSVNSK